MPALKKKRSGSPPLWWINAGCPDYEPLNSDDEYLEPLEQCAAEAEFSDEAENAEFDGRGSPFREYKHRRSGSAGTSAWHKPDSGDSTKW